MKIPVLWTLSAGLLGGVLAAPQPAPPLVPVDPQRLQDQETMTWQDYRPIPGTNWADNRVPGARVLRVALVAVDFPDQPFVITMPKQSDLFGNPQVDPVKREAVPQFYADFWGKPGALNHGHTIHEYWMEQSRGKVGIPRIDAYGPYRMPKHLFQYGLNEWDQKGGCPAGYVCDGRMEPDADALWAADKGADIKKNYDIVLRIYAGYDETSVWQGHLSDLGVHRRQRLESRGRQRAVRNARGLDVPHSAAHHAWNRAGHADRHSGVRKRSVEADGGYVEACSAVTIPAYPSMLDSNSAAV